MAKDSSAPKTSKIGRWRFGVQAGFLLAWLDPLMLRMHTVCSPVFHCYSCPLATFACPIGVLANFSAIHVWPWAAIGTLLVFGGLFGSFVCGWACPFGFLQDIIDKAPTPKLRLPAWTGNLRYLVLLALVLAIPYWYGDAHPLFICRVCPAGGLEAALPNTARLALAGDEVVWPSPAKIAIVGVFVVATLFIWRPWCTLFCPLGAIFGLCNRFSFLVLRFHRDKCRDCENCRSLCRGGHRPERVAGGLTCIRCMECKQCRAVSVSTVLRAEETRVGDP